MAVGSERSSAPAAGVAARRAAVDLLQNVLEEGGTLEDATGPSGAERAAARGLGDLALRRLGQVDDLLSRFVDKMPKGRGAQILRVMAAELAFAGTPPHAAVDTAVRVARASRGTARLAGLINAVGRRISEQGERIVAEQDAVVLNTPPWLGQALEREWGHERAREILAAHIPSAPHDLTMRHPADRVPFAEEVGGTLLPGGSVRLSGRPMISALPGYETGAWWVQDAAAALPARLLGPVEGLRVLDLCAAPGGKTMQLAAAGAEVTALDVSAGRMRRVRDNLERTGLTADLVVADALEWTPAAPFDAILLDAPCSASGTIRRHPELAHRRGNDAVTAMTGLQAAMLDRAMGWLAPGGTLVYATCSLFRAEGEAQIEAFLAREPKATLQPLVPGPDLPEELIRDGMLRTTPEMWADRGHLDGFFAARLCRV